MITNTSISSTGLVFSFDQSNPRSFKGPPLQNVLNQISTSSIGDNGTTYRFFSGSEDVYIPSVGTINNCAYVDMYNDYGGGSGSCCPAPFQYGGSLAVTGGTVYTYAILYRSINRYTNPNTMYHYEYNGGTYLTEFGVHNGGYPWSETDLGNGWYWSRAKFTSQPTASLFHTGSWMYQYATWNRMYVAKVMIVPGDYTSLHPVYWPDVATTRSNTQSLLDPAGNSTLTANSLVYAADGSFGFDGSTSYISATAITDSMLNSNSWSLSTWVKFVAVNKGSDNAMAGAGSSSTNNGLHLGERSSAVYFGFHGNDSAGTTTLSAGNWYNIVFTYNYSSKLKTIYVNGVYDNSGGTVGYTGTGNNFSLGYYPWASSHRLYGTMPASYFYSRELLPAEVAQNFNALRGRYGI